MSVGGLIRSDIHVIKEEHGHVAPYAPELLAVMLYRVAHALRERPGGRVVARLLTFVCTALTGATIDPQARIGPGFYIAHTVGVIVGLHVEAGSGLTLFGGTVLGSREGGSEYPILGDNVTLYAKASVIGGVKVGDGAVIGAHTLVLADVPPGATARGAPARF